MLGLATLDKASGAPELDRSCHGQNRLWRGRPILKEHLCCCKKKTEWNEKGEGGEGCEWRGVGGYWGCRETHTPINKEETLEAKWLNA